MKYQIFAIASLVWVLSAAAEESPVAIKGAEKVCEPGKKFTKDGSVCKCNAEGTEFACEKLDYPEGGTSSEFTPETVTGEKCTPGELYKDKCNECKCPESGLKSQAACTVIACCDE